MHDYERRNEELRHHFSYTSSLLSFLQKYLSQFHKALNTYSNFLKHFHYKTTSFLLETNTNYEFLGQTHHAFFSLSQTFQDEQRQLEQRAKLVKTTQLIVENLKQQIQSPICSKQKRKLNKCTYRLIRLCRQKKRHQLMQEKRKHDKLTFIWKTHLDSITLETTDLLWKVFSYSPYKFEFKSMTTSADSLANNETISDFSSPICLGSGDQTHLKYNLRYEPQREIISNSNNALLTLTHTQERKDDIRSLDPSETDKINLQNNRFDDDKDDEDDRWLNIVKENTLQRQQTTLSIPSDQNSLDSESIVKPNERRIQSKNSLHLSDVSYTTDYYSQNDSD